MSSPPATGLRLRPWPLFLDLAAISLPISFSDATYRIGLNIRYFLPNYTLIVLAIVLCSLIYHPLSLIIFLFISAAWFYLYFSHDSENPLIIFNYEIGENYVRGFLMLVTVIAVFFARVGVNLVVSVAIGALIACIHAALRAPEEDSESSPYGSLLSDVASPEGYTRV